MISNREFLFNSKLKPFVLIGLTTLVLQVFISGQRISYKPVQAVGGIETVVLNFDLYAAGFDIISSWRLGMGAILMTLIIMVRTAIPT